jgi:hypothetical protein
MYVSPGDRPGAQPPEVEQVATSCRQRTALASVLPRIIDARPGKIEVRCP